MFEFVWRLWRPISGPASVGARTRAKRRPAPIIPGIESLESRQLLSASSKGKGGEPEIRTVEVQGRVAKILNGTPTVGFPSVGKIGNKTTFNCSGTLIAPQWVLTAAHCSRGVEDTEGRFELNGTIYDTEKIFVHPDYRPRKFNSNKANDIALWKLTEPVVGVEPSPIFRDVPQVGTLLTLVGFGSGGNLLGETGDYGIKREGTTPLEKVTKTRIRWVFDKPTDSNTGHGDSGGPAYIRQGGVFYVAGVTSGGTKVSAGKGDRSFDTRVDVYQNWIDNVINGAILDDGPTQKLRHKHKDVAEASSNYVSLHDAVMTDVAYHL